jgi:ATP-dependent HslUV protease ATP-binding subunit HslU
MASAVNEATENIGARRLYTIMERLLDEVSFEAPQMEGVKVMINASYVRDRLAEVIKDQDLSRYIL